MQQIDSHIRSYQKGRFTTLPEHMPKAHQQYLEWTPQRLIRWAAETGPVTSRLVETILGSRTHLQQGFLNCLGILRLGKAFGTDRLENACPGHSLSGRSRVPASNPSLKTA